MSDQLETRTPEQLGEAVSASAAALVPVQEPGGPVKSMRIRRLLGLLHLVDDAYETRAELYADLNHDANAIALVYADPTPGNQGYYVKNGASGAGDWEWVALDARQLREDLGDSAGASLLGFAQAGTGAVDRTVLAKLRDTQDLHDRGADAAAALAAWADVFEDASGGRIRARAGTHSFGQAVTYAGQSLTLLGAGPKATSFLWDLADAAITLDTPGATGQSYSVISGLGFSSNNSLDKTVFHIVNGGNNRISDVAIVAFGGAGSIGIESEGRQMLRVRDVAIACARPILLSPNPTWPTIATDFYDFHSCELICTTAAGTVIELAQGVVVGNFSITKTALVGGATGFSFIDATVAAGLAASFGLAFDCVRVEQGTDRNGWSFDIRLTGNYALQSLTFTNVMTDTLRNGTRLRGVQSATMIDTVFAQMPRLVVTALATGAGGNAIASTETMAKFAFGGATLSWGATGVPARGELLPGGDGAITAAETVTLGATTYTFVTALSGAGQVLIGADPGETLRNLAAAINASAGIGSVYGTGTTANASVSAVAAGGVTLDVELTSSGGGLNLIGCTTAGAPAGVKRITKARCLYRQTPQGTGVAITGREEWVYFDPPAVASNVHDYTSMRPVVEQDRRVIGFDYAYPTGNRTVQLPMADATPLDFDIEVRCKAALSVLEFTYDTGGTLTVHTSTGVFAGTATSGKIYPIKSGSAIQLVGNTLVGATKVRVRIEQ